MPDQNGTCFALSGQVQGRCVVMQRTILLVDDNAPLRSTLADILTDDGLTTREAGTGSEALELVRQVRFDLLVLDLNLPDMTGVGLYRMVSVSLPGTGCIFMTAEASDTLVQEAMRLNPRSLLRKPFEVKRFRQLVAETVGMN